MEEYLPFVRGDVHVVGCGGEDEVQDCHWFLEGVEGAVEFVEEFVHFGKVHWAAVHVQKLSVT